MSGKAFGPTRGRRRAALAAAAALAALVAGAGGVADAAQPTSEDQLIAEVRSALVGRDLAALEELVNWDGASRYRRRQVAYQLRYGLGRPIRSISLEPFPADGFKEIEGRGTLRPNMPVTQQLRVVFDEPDNVFGKPPTELFLIGKQGEAYKIALVVPTKKPGGD